MLRRRGAADQSFCDQLVVFEGSAFDIAAL